MINTIKLTIVSLSVANILYGSIDITKRVIIVKNVLTLKQAYKITNKLDNYDIYIYKKENVKKPFYVISVVNLDKNNMSASLKNIKKISSYAYISSQAMANFIVKSKYKQRFAL